MMKLVYAPTHVAHQSKHIFFAGEVSVVHEAPIRVELVLNAAQRDQSNSILAPLDFGMEPLLRIHDRDYLTFLRMIWEEWYAAGRRTDAMPFGAPTRGMRQDKVPRAIDGKVSYYSFDTCAPINIGTWKAAYNSAQSALTAARLVQQGERAAIALCRPPGHHAGRDYCGGFCYINNAAIAAQFLLDNGATRVAILDVDFHHGNGTQSIFYKRKDVFVASIHGDPLDVYPFFLGNADEVGDEDGHGYNLNLPLPLGSGSESWFVALEKAVQAIDLFGPDLLIVSLGVDTFEGDPIGGFKLTSADFVTLGKRIERMNRPTIFVLEGGYAVEELGENVQNVISAFTGK